MIESLNLASLNDPAFCPNGCGRSYRGMDRRNSLKTHMIYKCGVNPKFKCVVCQKELRYKNSLQYHMVSAHKQFITKRYFMNEMGENRGEGGLTD